MAERIDFEFEEYCEAIRQFESCMDDYPYVMDLKNDKYFISQKALVRFNIDNQLFSDVLSEHGKFVYNEDLGMLIEDLNIMLAGIKNEHNLEYRWLDKNLQPVWINCRGKIIRDKEGNPAYMVGCINEIGKIAKADNVSGLLQSTSLINHLQSEELCNKKGYVLRIGIDGFKDINERFGIEYGDYILKGVAKCIAKHKLPGQELYHVVADEYLLVDFNGGNEEDAHEMYRNIRRDIDTFIEENEYEAVYTISGGIIFDREDIEFDYNTIMKLSEFALSEAKSRGKNQVYIFQDNDYSDFLRKRKLLGELKKAVANDFNGFELYFQPIMTAEGERSKLYAAESLLRFITSDGERVSPFEFIPVLEASGLIIPVGRWVLDNAASMCKQCQAYVPDFKISINISYVQIMKSALLNEVFNTVARHALKPESLIMELTESGFVEDSPTVKRVWDSLKKFGVLIAIDDFGTGYSNIQSISKMTPDIIKLDRGFTVKALTNDFENQLMNNVIQLVHSIDLKICVEGVETVDELDKLMGMEPNYIQGYYYSRPCPKSEFLHNFINV